RPAPPVDAPRVPDLVIRRDGEGWIVEGGGASARVADVRGMHLLARLLERPGEEIHVLDLVADGDDGPVDTGDAGEVLDARARAAYRARVEALRDELEEAEA